MRMMKTLILTALSTMVVSVSAQAEDVPSGKAAELACHRIERLVTLKKIDASFLTKLYAIQLVRLNAASPTDPVFKAIGIQLPGADGTFKKVEMMMDGAGKSLAQTIIPGTEGPELSWPGKDPVSLIENALHYVLENGTRKANVKPFLTGLTEIVLSQENGSDGKILAKTVVKSSETANRLEIILKDDGTFVSAEVLK